MPDCVVHDDQQLARWPLPLAQLARRALNSKTILDRHSNAFYLFEAHVKLMASVAIAQYLHAARRDPAIDEQLKRLARPSLGHWWAFVRVLAPFLAKAGDEEYAILDDVLFGRSRSDFPRAAGLDAALKETNARRCSQSRVRLAELFDRLVAYRNTEMGHGAYGQRPAEFYDAMSKALLAGIGEVVRRLDLLAGRRLLYVADVRRRNSGTWSVDQYELLGEAPRKMEPAELPSDCRHLPISQRVYAVPRGAGFERAASLYPLVWFDDENARTYLLNARRRQDKVEYLCYQTGDRVERAEMGTDHRELLGLASGHPVDAAEVDEWSAQSTDEATGPSVPMPGRSMVLGEFDVVSELGRGAMGVVYRAWQPSLEREVALKSLLRVGDPKTEKRFHREIRALARVEHPNLVKIFTSGADRDRWFYAMELIEGASLADLCDVLSGAAVSTVDDARWQAAITRSCERARNNEKVLGPDGSLPLDARRSVTPVKDRSPGPDGPPTAKSYIASVVELIRQAAEAAHALHEAGIVHRDIKPANIMVTECGTRAVLTDLGLAKIADEMTGTSMGTRGFVGTLRYASPEQLEGLASVDRRADVYSLGATLWELVTLKPFLGIADDTPTPELILKIHQADPDDPAKYNPSLPKELAAVVLKCVEKDRDRRYPTARDLAMDLARWQQGDLVLARPVTTARRVHRRLLRLRTHLTWTAIGAGAATLGFLVLSRL